MLAIATPLLEAIALAFTGGLAQFAEVSFFRALYPFNGLLTDTYGWRKQVITGKTIITYSTASSCTFMFNRLCPPCLTAKGV